MFKLFLVVLAVLAVASAQYLASPYAYSGLYRSSAYHGNYAATPLAYSGAYAYPSAYTGYTGYPTAYLG